MAFVNPPQPDQTAMRHGSSVKKGKAVHRFPISAVVKTILNKVDCTQGLYMAKDMCCSSGSTTAVVTFFKATKTLESSIELVIKVAFSHKYDKMKRVWSAGKLLPYGAQIMH
ncbi:hypothetical protein B0H19DRAFT_1058228 [Mycena capillaripes]|nr:hypothetical protein B0H19DRAFT_1058228 [Mycena capillaripes]